MKAMWMAFAAMIVITIGAAFALQQIGWSAEDKGSTDSNVRLD